MAGKGSAPRRDRDGSAKNRFDANYDRIFGKKDDDELEENKDEVLGEALMTFRDKPKKIKGEEDE